MAQILIGGDRSNRQQLEKWLDTWGLQSAPLGPGSHPATVPVDEASAVIYACGPEAPPLPGNPGPASATAPLLLVGDGTGAQLDSWAWTHVQDPGPDGGRLAAALRPCLEASAVRNPSSPGFRDFLNHELRTPLTAAGTALQTLALQLERAGGQPLDLVDIALRNVRRLEQTVDWACDYLAVEPDHGSGDTGGATNLTDLLQDLDEVDAPMQLSWATGAGDWYAPVDIDRERWRRILRQVLRAVGFQAPGQAVHLELSTLSGAPGESGLLLAFQVAPADQNDQVQRTGATDEAEQLRRLLAFTVNPDLARRLSLRFDVVRHTGHLRLRVLVPMAMAAPEPQTA